MRSDMERHFAQFDDQDLQRQVAIRRGDYTAEAIIVAEEELRRRSLRVLTAEEYLKAYPHERITPSGFCESCFAATTDEAPGNRLNGIPFGFGRCLVGEEDRCPACGSILQSKMVLFVLPVAKLGEYRVIYPHGRGDRYIGRKVRSMGGADTA